jgi:hypothetical protein
VRLLRASLSADLAAMDRWNCSLDFVASLPSSRDEVEVVFASPPRQAQSEYYKRFPPDRADVETHRTPLPPHRTPSARKGEDNTALLELVFDHSHRNRKVRPAGRV